MDKKDEDEELSDDSIFLAWVDLAATLPLIQKQQQHTDRKAARSGGGVLD